MRHQKGNKKLGKPTDQRIALLRSLTRALFKYNRINTTDVRAKEAKRFAEKLITLGKKETVYARRLAMKMLPDKDIVKDIFNNIAPKYKNRAGGYTRIIKVGFRRGDSAPISMLEFVE
jgi:large subunit ribosomal protein L17